MRCRRPAFEHEFVEFDQTAPDQVVARLAGATIAITNEVPLTAEVIAQLPSLKLIAVAATGTDCVDKAACERQGVRVSNIRGCAVNTVPEHTFALMLALRRNLIAYRDDVLNGEWQKSGQFCIFNHAIHDLGGMTLATTPPTWWCERTAARRDE